MIRIQFLMKLKDKVKEGEFSQKNERIPNANPNPNETDFHKKKHYNEVNLFEILEKYGVKF